MELKLIGTPYVAVEKAKEVDKDVAAALAKIEEGKPIVVAIESAEQGAEVLKAFRLAAKVAGRKIGYKAVVSADGTKGIEFRQPRVRAKGDSTPEDDSKETANDGD